MSEIKFECPNCSQHISAPEELLGAEIECPGCARQVKVQRKIEKPPSPSPAPKPNSPPPEKSVTQPSSKTPTLHLWVLLAIGAAIVYLLNQQVEAIKLLAPKNNPSPKWEYKVETYDDATKRMDEYESGQLKEKKITQDQYLEELSSNDRYYNGRFDMIEVKPGEDWELCAHFIEPRADHPKLILIFKRPL